MASTRPRVVFVPGTMGSVLVDVSLYKDPDGAERICEDNLGPVLSAVSEASLAGVCEGRKPAVVWGKFGMLHWLLDTEKWVERLTTGNGIDRSWTEGGRVVTDILQPSRCPRRPRRSFLGDADPIARLLEEIARRDRFPELASFTVSLGLLTSAATAGLTEDQVHIDPYGDFLQGLCEEGCDVLVFPYDWRLSNAFNATRLAAAIHARWWRRRRPAEIGPDSIPPDQRVTIIAHSMGGLIARFFIEAETADVGYIRDRAVRRTRLAGHRYVRQLITIGTPHLGAPLAYTTFAGDTKGFEEIAALKYLRMLSANSSLDTGGLPLGQAQQRTLSEHYSSLIELFPVYRFMPRENTEDLLDSDAELRATYQTYVDRSDRRRRVKPMLHASNYWAWRMLAEFRRHLVPAPCLDHWLIRHGVKYVFAAGDDFTERVDGKWEGTTVTAYDDRKGAIPTTRGDNVVPWRSAAMYPYVDRAQSIQWIPVRGTEWDHQMLCRHPTVRDACLGLLSDQGPPKRVALHHLTRAELRALVEQLLKIMGYAGRAPRAVISLVDVEFRDPVDGGVLPFRNGGSGWVVEPHRLPAGAIYCRPDAKEFVCRFEHGKVGGRQFVAIRNAFPDPTKALVVYGGVLFLPDSSCARSLEVLTWNVGTMTDLQRSATNETHSERQLAEWFTAWFKHLGWRDHVAALSIRNVELSPCSQCVDDLTSMASLVGGRVSRRIAWKKLYSTTTGAGPTDRAEVRKLERADWQVVPGSEMPAR